MKEQSIQLGKEWQAMSREEKLRYVDQYERDKERYHQEMQSIPRGAQIAQVRRKRRRANPHA